ncbi:MAG: hypothetical protein ACPL1G_05945 [Thermodesulfovibrionales bacterium]
MTISKFLIASIYLLWVSVFGMMNLFFEDTGILLRKRSFSDICFPSGADLIA